MLHCTALLCSAPLNKWVSSDYQFPWECPTSIPILITLYQETLNYWKQLSHVMKYFRPEEDPGARLPRNFVSGFLEGRN